MARRVITREAREARLVLRAVDEYRDKGWHPLPLPLGQKWPPPKGYTGADHRVPDNEDYDRWERTNAWGNIALVMPRGVIGYDVDAYKGGQLPPGMPPSMRSTSRDDGSGIYLYTIPPGTQLEPNDGPGIDILQYHHRFAVVWPSLHPEGRIYHWLWPHNQVTEHVPDLRWLKALPDSHLQRLRVARKTAGGGSNRSSGGFTGDWMIWVDKLPSGHMSWEVHDALRKGLRGLQDGSCRYDTMVSACSRLIGFGNAGHRGVPEAMDKLIDAYLAAVDGAPAHPDPHGELDRAIGGAVRKYARRRRF